MKIVGGVLDHPAADQNSLAPQIIISGKNTTKAASANIQIFCFGKREDPRNSARPTSVMTPVSGSAHPNAKPCVGRQSGATPRELRAHSH
jgi:hypothetical protein